MREQTKPSKPRYQHKPPKFRTNPSQREQLQWRHSVYYWWWRYLRLNDDYRRCCEKGGRGSMGKLYRQFGDVFYTHDFRTWWLNGRRGETLFAEPAPQETLRELRSVREWNQTWKRSDVMVVAVPLSDPKWRLARSFAALLKDRHAGKPGVVSTARSGATRSVYGKFSVPALETMCKVYELHKTAKATGAKLTLAQIGKKAGVRIDYGSKTKEKFEYDDTAQRNVMASTVSRYLKKASVLIAFVGQGDFPRFE